MQLKSPKDWEDQEVTDADNQEMDDATFWPPRIYEQERQYEQGDRVAPSDQGERDDYGPEFH